MSEDIINEYRQAIAKKQGVTETTETPSLCATINEIVDTQLSTITGDDPFKNFLGTLSSAIKEKTVLEEKKKKTEAMVQAAIEEATVVEPIETKVKEVALEFIEKLKGEEESILPQSLKKYVPKTIKEVSIPKKIKQKINLKNKPVTKKEVVSTEKITVEDTLTPETSDNTYVKQLITADKNKTLPEKVQKVSNIKQLISSQVKEEIEKVKIQISKMALEGGGGSVAQQFANGGTMKGDLNVTGKYLSGGVDLTSIFSGGGGGTSDRLISGSQSLILNPDGTVNLPDLNGSDTNWLTVPDGELLNIESSTDVPGISGYSRITLSPYGFFAYDNNSNSIGFSTADNNIVIDSQDQYNWTFRNDGVFVGPNSILSTPSISSQFIAVSSINASGHILSGGRDLSSIFLTAETDAQTLSFNENSEFLTISNGNTVALSSIRLAANSFASNNFLALSGGLVQGPVQINNNLTVFGNLTASGTTTFANTVFTTTSSLSVVHLGSGPALYVGNYGNDHIATFVDLQNSVEMLHIGGLSSSFPNIGVKTNQPSKDFTVNGEISASNTIWDNVGNSTQWNTAYSYVSSQSLNTNSNVQFNEINANVYLSGGINLFNLLSSSGGGAGDPAVNTLVRESSAVWFPVERQFDFTTAGGVDISYSGTALYSTLITSPTWSLIRLTYNDNGTISNQASAYDSWTGRLTASYI